MPGLPPSSASQVSLRPAADFSPAVLCELFNRAFGDYIAGPFVLRIEEWPQFLGRQGVDLQFSRVACLGGEPCGLALVCPRPDVERWRVAGMGVAPGARRSGAASRLLDDLTERAGYAQCSAVELEVFAANEPAVALYRGHGFEAVYELRAYRSGPRRDMTAAEVVVVPLPEAVSWLSEAGRVIEDLPFQVLGQSLQALQAPLEAWRCGTAQVVFSSGSGAATTIHSLIDLEGTQRSACTLATALLARFQGASVVAGPLQRADVGGVALQSLGFVSQSLWQRHMFKVLK